MWKLPPRYVGKYAEQDALITLKLWENLSTELNYNVMFSQRGVLNLAHNEHDIKEIKRRP